MLTRVLSDPQVAAAAVTVGLTVLAAVIGFLIREWIARAKPFISMVHIYDHVRTDDNAISVPSEAHREMKKAVLLSDLAEDAQVGQVEKVVKECGGVRDQGPQFLEEVARLRAAVKSNDSTEAALVLRALLMRQLFDDWLTMLLGDGNVQVPASDGKKEAIIPCEYSPSHREGAFFIGFPGQGATFGSALERIPIMKQRVSKFMALIERCEMEKIDVLLDSAARIVKEEIAIAKDVLPVLQDLLGQQSQWCFRLFLANLSSAPFLVNCDAILEVRDANGGRYSESLCLISLQKDSEERLCRYQMTQPLIVRAASDALFEFATDKIQAQMKSGAALRVAFKSGTARCWLRFTLERPGIRRHQKMVTRQALFS